MSRAARRRSRQWISFKLDEGAATVPAWTSRDQFNRAIEATLAASGWRADRKASFVGVAKMLADAAEHSTGRNVALSSATIAKALKISRATVFRRLADMGEHGLVHTVDRGERLPMHEVLAIREKTGRFVFRKASTRFLSVPSRMAADLATATPSTPSGVDGSAHLSLTHQARKRAGQASSISTTDQKPRSLPLQRLAATIDRQTPWLLKGAHPGSLADALVKAGVDEGWSARDVIDSIDGWHAAQGRANAGAAAKNPLGWMIWALGQAIAAGAKPRKVRLVDEATARIARNAARAAEQERAERERVAPEKASSILAGARAALAASKAAREAAEQAERERAGTLESQHAALLERKRADALAYILAA